MSEEAPFTSEIRVFSGCSGFLPQGKLAGGVRINTVRKVIS
jgi:hypothetical protein